MRAALLHVAFTSFCADGDSVDFPTMNLVDWPRGLFLLITDACKHDLRKSKKKTTTMKKPVFQFVDVGAQPCMSMRPSDSLFK